MNRRAFFLSASASFLIGQTAKAQRGSGTSTTVVSEFTGALIDFTESGFTLDSHEATPEEGIELVTFQLEQGLVYIAFMEAGMDDLKSHLVSNAEQAQESYAGYYNLGEADYDDGGWIAFQHEIDLTTYFHYYEYQLGAFPQHDLIIMYSSSSSTFLEDFSLLQTIQVDGLPPFLFAEDSQIVSLVESASPSTSSTGSGLRRGGQRSTTATEEADTPSRSSRSSSSTDNAGTTGASPVDAVLNHRAAFVESYDSFIDLLAIFSDDAATDREIEDNWMLMMNIALEWQGYPDQAAQVSFSAEYADLESLYMEWADCIGEMGLQFENFALNDADIDGFITARDLCLEVDAELLEMLSSYSISPGRRPSRLLSRAQARRALTRASSLNGALV